MKKFIASAVFLILCYGISAWAESKAVPCDVSEGIHISFTPNAPITRAKHIIRHENVKNIENETPNAHANLEKLIMCKDWSEANLVVEKIERVMNMFGRMSIYDLGELRGVSIAPNNYNTTHGWMLDDDFEVDSDIMTGSKWILNLPRVKRLEND